MKQIFFLKGDNVEVINFYFSVVEKSFRNVDWKVTYVDRIDKLYNLSKSDYIFVAECMHAMNLLMRGYKNIIFWAQGIVPEEDYLRKSSKLRRAIFSFSEKFVLKRSRMVLLVSKKMKEHYEKKYRIDLSKAIIMPCFNTTWDKSLVKNKEYEENIFCYVGSMAKWQYFDKTVDFYKKIEDALKGKSFFKILTPNIQEAQHILEQKKVKNFSVEFVKQELLLKELLKCKFGFILREDNVINNVATPTKMSAYLSAGIIPIYSECIDAFKLSFKDYKYLIPVSNSLEVDPVLDVCQQIPDKEDVFKEFASIFETFYNPDVYITEITNQIKSL